MHCEVVEDDVANRFEWGALDPSVVPVEVDVHCVRFADQAGVDGLLHVADVWSPAAVLVYGELQIFGFGKLGEAFRSIEVEGKRLLTEHMFACVEGCFDYGDSRGWM